VDSQSNETIRVLDTVGRLDGFTHPVGAAKVSYYLEDAGIVDHGQASCTSTCMKQSQAGVNKIPEALHAQLVVVAQDLFARQPNRSHATWSKPTLPARFQSILRLHHFGLESLSQRLLQALSNQRLIVIV
jgi:hypothetical protein